MDRSTTPSDNWRPIFEQLSARALLPIKVGGNRQEKVADREARTRPRFGRNKLDVNVYGERKFYLKETFPRPRFPATIRLAKSGRQKPAISG